MINRIFYGKNQYVIYFKLDNLTSEITISRTVNDARWAVHYDSPLLIGGLFPCFFYVYLIKSEVIRKMLFNTHTHLNSEQLFENRDLYIQNAIDRGVKYFTVVGYDLESSRLAVQIAHEYDFIYAAVGISPNDCKETTDEDLEAIEALAKDPKVVAVGEIGLDYYWDEVSKEKQIDCFKKQLEIAKRLSLPVTIHARDAYEDTLDILSKSGVKGIMHCYSGSYEMALRFIKIGYYISLAGPVTFKNAKVPKRVAESVDLNYLLVETDDPYLTPAPYRGKQNEPGNVYFVAQKIAELKGLSYEEVAKQTTENALKVFQLKK